MSEAWWLPLCLAAWPLAGLVLFLSARRHGDASVGLPMAYLIGWGVIHWPGAMLYLFPDHSFHDYDTIVDGFKLSTSGLLGYMLGYFLAQPKMALVRRGQSATTSTRSFGDLLSRASIMFLFIGMFTQLVLMPLFGRLPSITALLSGVATLSVTGACLGLHQSLLRRRRAEALGWLLVACAFPFVTLTSAAFLGFGTMSMIVVVGFAAMYIPRRRIAIALALAVPAAYLALSLFVTYMRDRSELRQILWYEQPSQIERFNRVANLFSEFEFLDLQLDDHRVAIDERLNQNHLVGAAQGYLDSGFREFTYGESILEAFLALVPRALWPGKPTFGGGGNTVAEFTGLTFAEGTSVGIGQVLEFYVNFGDWGVFLGYVVLGAVIRAFDFRAARALRGGDYRHFVVWFLPGMALLQAGGNLAEVSASLAAAVVAGLGSATLLERYLSVRLGRRRRADALLESQLAQHRRRMAAQAGTTARGPSPADADESRKP